MDWKEIKTWEDVCKANNESPDVLPDVSKLSEKDKKYTIDHHKLVKAIEAVNGEWKPDAMDTSQTKWVLWPDVVEDKKQPSGFGLSYNDFDFWHTFTRAGSRLCVESREKLKHVFENFYELYHSHFIG